MSNEIAIGNPMPGGRTHTSLKKARFLIERKGAFIQDGRLFFPESAQRIELPAQPESQRKVYLWSGSSCRHDLSSGGRGGRGCYPMVKKA